MREITEKITLFTKQELLLADSLKPCSRYKTLATRNKNNHLVKSCFPLQF